MSPEAGTRRVGSVALAVVAGLLCVLAVTSMWARGLVYDSDRFVDVASQTLADPQVHTYVSGELTSASLRLVDTAIEQLKLPTVAAAPLRALARAKVPAVVDAALRSESFAAAWQSTARATHALLINEIEASRPSGSIQVDLLPGLVVVLEQLRLQVPQLFPTPLPAVTATTDPAQLRTDLSAALGFEVPATAGVVRVPEPRGFAAIANAVQLLDVAAFAISVVAVFLLLVGLVLRGRRTFVIGYGYVVAGWALLTWLLVNAVPGIALSAVDLGSTKPLADAAVEVGLSTLRHALLVLIVVALAVAVVVQLVTRSRPNQRTPAVPAGVTG